MRADILYTVRVQDAHTNIAKACARRCNLCLPRLFLARICHFP